MGQFCIVTVGVGISRGFCRESNLHLKICQNPTPPPVLPLPIPSFSSDPCTFSCDAFTYFIGGGSVAECENRPIFQFILPVGLLSTVPINDEIKSYFNSEETGCFLLMVRQLK